MADKPKTQSTEELARVGTQPSDVPAEPAKKKGWLARRRRVPSEDLSGERQGIPSSGKWSPSAKEEMERFKGAPVVGDLPWRTQYMALAAVLAISLLVVVVGALSSKDSGVAGVVERSTAVGTVRTQAMAALAGGEVDISQVEQALSGTEGLPASAQWQAFVEAAGSWLSVERRWEGLSRQAREASGQLGVGASEARALWSAMEQEGSAARPEALELVRVVGAYDTLAAKLSTLSKGQMVATDTERARVASGFQAFRRSPLVNQSDLAITRAWRATSAAWAQASPALGELVDEDVAEVLSQRSRTLSELSSAAESWARASASAPSAGPGLFTQLAGVLALVSLALLLVVAWKQQRWHVLSARSVSEQVDQAVFDLANDLAPLGQGDLTRRARVSELPVGVVAETINRALDQLRPLLALSKKTAAETSEASMRANEATGVLVNSQRERLAGLESSSQDILRLIESVGTGANDAQTSKDLTGRALKAARSGQGAVVSSIERIHDIQERVEEASSRAQRLVDSSNEIAGMALTLKEIAEQLEILGMQADLQASKAGDAGQGFKVVAREVQQLSEASGARARHVSSLVETALSDLEALSASMQSAASGVAEGSRFTELTHEAWGEVLSSLQELAECINSLHDSSMTQKELASTLDERTRRELGQVETDNKNAQEASEATLKLLASVRALDEAVSKFKA